MDLRQPTVFGEVAELYDRVRPGYPDHLFRDLVAHCDLEPGSRVVEIGAGTGKATEGLVALGLGVMAIEASPQMADVLQAKELPGVSVVIGRFDTTLEPIARTRLVFCAQSWHWVDDPGRYRAVHDLLMPDGHVALVWNLAHELSPELDERLGRVYAAWAPELVNGRPGHTPDRAVTWTDEINHSGLFGPVMSLSYVHGRTLAPDEYVDLVATFSDHRILPVEQRDGLLAAIARELAGERHIDLTYNCRLLMAQRNGVIRRT